MQTTKVARVCSKCKSVIKSAYTSCPKCDAHFRGENQSAKTICSVCGGDFPFPGKTCSNCGRNIHDIIIKCEKDDCGKTVEMVYNSTSKTYDLKG